MRRSRPLGSMRRVHMCDEAQALGCNCFVGDQTHALAAHTPDAMFVHPKGVLGRLGGMIMARMNRDAAEQVIELLDVQSDDKILEVGFGAGVAIQLLLHRAPAASVSGVEKSQEVVHQAMARNAHALRSGQVDLRYGSVERLPFANETFAKAFAINSMQAWPDARGGLREIWRALKDGGNMAFEFAANSSQPKEVVAESLAAAGLRRSGWWTGPNSFA
jgi:ubiquinone/menaquinone biosynthesis C-methylase UbiE